MGKEDLALKQLIATAYLKNGRHVPVDAVMHDLTESFKQYLAHTITKHIEHYAQGEDGSE